jgi:tetratricopeptide (TPR) repeat protein
MLRLSRRRATLPLACLALLASTALAAAAPTPARNDYNNTRFTSALATGLHHFYARDFKKAQADFERALLVVSDNTLAISFLNAAAAQQPGALDVLTNVEEDTVAGTPKNYVNHVRLGFTYMFESLAGRDRMEDARDELNSAVNLSQSGQAAHVGLGIMRYSERSANRAKTELLLALHSDPNNVLAREYLGQIYQTDLRDPQRGLSYIIDVPNLVPDYADIQFHIGSLLYDLGQPQGAIPYVIKGITLDDGHVGEAGQHGFTLLARIYLDQKKFADAKRVLEAAIADDADAIYARTLLRKLNDGDYSAKPSADATPSGLPLPEPQATATAQASS